MVNVPFSNRPAHVLSYTISTSNNNGSTIDITWTASVNTSGNTREPFGTGSATHSTSPSTTYVGGQSNATWSVPYDYRGRPNYDFTVGSGTRRVSLGSSTRTFSISVSLGSLIGSASASIDYTPPSASRTVPSIVGNTEGDAIFLITNAGLSANFVGNIDTSDSFYSGQSIVATQSPAAGTTVTSGSNVNYTVYRYVAPPPPPPAPPTPSSFSSGTITTSSIPTSWGASSGATGYELFRDGSFVASTSSTSYTFSSLASNTSYTLGVRAYTTGAGGTSYSSTTTITRSTLSINFTTPNVIGQSRSVAINTLQSAGFGSVVVTDVTSGATLSNNLLTFSQSPAAGTTSIAGTSAAIDVYDFRTAVPSIIGQTETQALATLTSAGFNSRSSSLTTSGATVSNNLKVGSQTPTAGTQANPVNTVTFTIFNFLTSVPNVVGQTLDNAITNLGNLGFVTISTTLDETGATEENVGTVKSQTPVNSATTFNPANTSVTLTIYSLGVTGKRSTGTGFVALSNAKRFDGTVWQPITVAKRFNGTTWLDISN